MASRAHLLSGLRTGGPQVDAESPRHSPRYSDGNRSLKADAAPFTPGSTRMASPLALDGQTDLATLYGASHGQPQQQQDMTNLIRQRQAQILQQQLMAQQQQQQQQQQLEMLRLHAASQQQQHLQEVAVQQRLLLAQMQAEYNFQQQEQVFSAQDQRKAAQASIQASLRQRQAEQMYAQLLSQHESNDAQVQQQQLLQQLQLLQLQAATMQNMHDHAAVDDMGQSRRNNPSRTDSPNSQQARRDRQASHAAAESATSWRSTSLAIPKQSSTSTGRGGTPSIVVDDSGSEKSEGNCSDNETPETSEEDIGLSSDAAKASQKTGGNLLMERRTPSNPPRPIALSLAPRSRNLSAEVKLNQNVPNGVVNNATRQPRGPPTEFLPINFHTRLSARTRREVMSKLCASPRAATFATASRPGVVV